jgi:hypothetical protein
VPLMARTTPAASAATNSPDLSGERGDLGCVGARSEDHTVVVSGDRKDRAVVVPEWLVELVVVIQLYPASASPP